MLLAVLTAKATRKSNMYPCCLFNEVQNECRQKRINYIVYDGHVNNDEEAGHPLSGGFVS